MKYRIFTFLFLQIIVSSIIAQSNFKKGYIVSLKGDTLKGFINFKEWTRTPAQIEFKPSLDKKTTHYSTVQNTQAIVIEGYETYERFVVSVSMNEIDYNKIEPNAISPDKSDTVFLKVISEGDRTNLYAYRDKLKERFYVLVSPQTIPTELEFKIESRDNQLSSSPIFRIQLHQIASKYADYTPRLKSLIESASYSKNELKKIVDQMNTINEKEGQPQRNRYKRSRFIVGAGLNYSGITYKGPIIINANGLDINGNPASKDQTTTHSSLPVIYLGYDLFFHPAIQRSYLRTELSLTAFRSKATSLYKFPLPYNEELVNNYDLLGVSVSLTPQLIYNIYNKQKLGMFVGSGLSLRYSFYPSQTLKQYTNKHEPGYSDKVIENFFNMKSISVIPAFCVGAIINKKIGFGVIWNLPSELTSTYKNTTSFVKEKSLHFNVNYFF